ACVVWLPTDMHEYGRCLLVSPQMISTFSHGNASTSADTRARSNSECVPRLPTPVWTYSLPSGRIVSRPSWPMEPDVCVQTETPTPRTLLPFFFPARAARAFQLKRSAPRSSASRTNALVVY